ncbi:MAG: type III-B CRISPR module RAMP protein Cmr4 [Anaerolineales bacterium]|nr:type III-B CRISPR module RAMP protein Cmr4 [Anaerolineales bacterium]
MKQKTLYLFTRTPLHVGAGSSVGAVDMPVQRERHTGFPIIPGSSLKGVLADGEGFLERGEDGKLKRSAAGHDIFGKEAGKNKEEQGKAGSLCFGEAQLLAFPVRSAKGCFAWLTSPLCLKRWQRASGIHLDNIPDIKESQARFDLAKLGQDGKALFEDYIFNHLGDFTASEKLAEQIKVDGIWQDLAKEHLVLVSDDALSHFARSACEVAQHVVIDDETGTAKDGFLFNQENVPSETLFFSTITEQKEDCLEKLKIPNPIQVGGNATTGLGFCSTQLS